MRTLRIRSDDVGKPLVHHWTRCVGGGRVGEAMRADFQRHLEVARREIGFAYIRMHGLFHEDMMVYREEQGRPVYNWQYVDLVFDHWLSIGVRPFVELGFMPYAMASGTLTVFWWAGNVTPPKDWERWGELVERFARHCIERYGVEEVRRWYFEVWNEPNLDFFWEHADFKAYMKLYEASARALKRVDERLRVGGPATAGSCEKRGQAPWANEFLSAVRKAKLPLDFFSTHPYPTRHPVDLKGVGFMEWDGPDRLAVDLDGIRRDLRKHGYGKVETHCTEWSSSPSPRDRVHDTAFLAPFLVQNNILGRGKTDSLSFWVVSDIFEENRQGDTPFHGGFGLINIQGLKKPSFHGYWFLSRLGTKELAAGPDYIATRRDDGTLVILLWNYCHYRADVDSRKVDVARGLAVYDLFEEEPPAGFRMRVSGLAEEVRVQETRFDREHGSVFDAYCAMGAPEHIVPADLEVLRRKAELHTTVARRRPRGGALRVDVTVPPHGVVLLEISSS